MKRFRQILALVLTLVMLISALPLQAMAQQPQTAKSSLDTGDLNIEGTNSFGTLVSSAINQQDESPSQEEYEAGYSVTNVLVEGNQVTVTYDSLEDANLVVGIYSEDGMKLLASASQRVKHTETVATLSISGEMPQYFLVSAYLLDIYDFSPLCASYESPMYTQDMQALLALSVEEAESEYGADRVYNLDDSEDTNFAVYAEGSIVIDETVGVNTLVSADEENLLYTFSNIDERISGLNENDVVIYSMDEGDLLIFKVASIEVSGTDAVITGMEMELGDAFSLMKLENTGDAGDVEMDPTNVFPEMEYVGMSGGAQTYGARSARGVDSGGSVTYTEGFDFDMLDKEVSGKLDTGKGILSGEGKISAGFHLGITVSLNVYLSLKRQYISFTATPDITLNITFEGKVALTDAALGYLGWAPIPGVFVSFEPTLTIEFSGSVTLVVTAYFTVGVSAEHKTGKKMTINNLSTNPKVDYSLDIEATLFIGLDLTPKIAIISDQVAEAKMTGRVGVQITGTMGWGGSTAPDSQEHEIHACNSCIAGNVKLIANLTATIKFLDSKKLTLTLRLFNAEVHLADFYYSFDKGAGKFGSKCPYKKYWVIPRVEDEDMNIITGVTVKLGDGTVLGKTNENGAVEGVYLTPGTHTFHAVVNGVTEATSYKVNRACIVYITCDGIEDEVKNEVVLPSILPDNISSEVVPPSDDVVASGDAGENITWTLHNDGSLDIRGKGPMEEYSHVMYIPWSYYADQVYSIRIHDGITTICQQAFDGFVNLSKVILPASLKEIGQNAFYECESLTSIILPSNLEKIGDGAFVKCTNLRSINFPKKLKSIGSTAFFYCASLQEIVLPSGITELADSTFSYCTGLRKVTFPSMLTSIGRDCFEECTNLTELVIPDSVNSIGTLAFQDCSNIKRVTIPVEAQGDSSFSGCTQIEYIHYTCGSSGIMQDDDIANGCRESLKTVIIDEGVQTICDWAFDSTMISTVLLPSTLKTIGSYAFQDTKNLKSVSFPQGLETIGDHAFTASGIETLILPGSLKTIGDYAFSSSYSLKKVIIDENTEGGTTSVCDGAFSNLIVLEEIVLSNSVSYIGRQAIDGGGTAITITLPVDADFFRDDSDYSVNPGYTFEDVVIFTGGRTGVMPARENGEPYYFEGNRSLNPVFDESVREIGNYALNTYNIWRMYFLGDAPVFHENSFAGLHEYSSGIQMYYPANNPTWTEDVLQQYGTTLNWMPYDPDEVFGDDLAVTLDSAIVEATLPELGPDIPETEEESTAPTVDAVYGGENNVEEENGVTVYTASFSGLVPGKEYVFLALYGTNMDQLLAPENIIFIDQATAEEDGTLEFRYQISYSGTLTIFACGASHRNLKDAVITVPEMIANGAAMLAQPSVVYGDETLRDNIDYVIVDGAVAKDPGDYVLTLRGICNYSGLVEVPYTVLEDPTHVDSGTCGEDLIWDLDTAGNLTISGGGSMEETPWDEHKDSVTTLIIDANVGGLTEDALAGLDNLKDIFFGGNEAAWNALNVAAGENVSVHFQVEDMENHWTTETHEANCTEAGYTQQICTCGNKRNYTQTDSALDHDWGSESFLWSEDFSSCKITLICIREKCGIEETHDCEVSSEAYAAKNCKEQSYVTQTASYQTWSDEEKIMGEFGPHKWKAATCTAPKTCELCEDTEGESLKHFDSETDKDHICDTCDKVMGTCADKDGDNACDSCGATICEHGDKTAPWHICDKCGKPVSNCADGNKDHKCDVCSKELTTCTDEDQDYKCDICGKELEKPAAPSVEGVTRLAGANRLVTSELIANQLKDKMGVEKFENIIVASGGTFADALPGSYLAAVKNAPILLTLAKDKYVNQTADYIKANLKDGGTVYILGGESAVPASMEKALNGLNVKRVAGKDRFGTNLEILKEAGVKPGDEILVCTAKEFADSLSAAATGKPILLVYKKITDEQKAYLSTLSGNTFCVVGGTSAVPENLAEAMKAYGNVSRLAGKDRLDTSILVAKKYFPDARTSVVAYGWDFPDGLCGGSLAYATKSPLILAHSKEKLFKFTADYTVAAGLKAGFVLGGDKLVTDAAAQAIFGMAADGAIEVLK